MSLCIEFVPFPPPPDPPWWQRLLDDIRSAVRDEIEWRRGRR